MAGRMTSEVRRTYTIDSSICPTCINHMIKAGNVDLLQHIHRPKNTYVIAYVIKLYLFAPAMKVSRLFKATKAELTLAL